MKTRTAVALWTLALAAAAVSTWIVSTTGHADAFTVRSALSIAVALTFVGAGVVVWYRRPDNRTGGIMVLTGFAWFAGALTQADNPFVFSLAVAVNDIPWAFFAWLVLAYPTGRLEDTLSKVIVGAAFAVTIILRPLWTLFSNLDDVHPNHPENVFLVEDRPNLAAAILHVEQAFALALIAVALWVLRARWLVASPPLRRTLTPVFLTFGITVVILAVAVILEASGVGETQVLYSIALVGLLTVPLGFAAGLLRTRLARAGVSELLVELDDPSQAVNLRDALARALGDPSLEVAYWLPDSREYVDSRGRPMPWPLADGEPRHATVVERDGGPVAALIHDVSVLDDPALLEAVTAAAGLSLENERRLTELTQSETRLRALVDALPDLMFRISKDGTYLDVKGSEDDLVRPAAELVGSTLHERLPTEVADTFMRAIARARPGRIETIEYQLRVGSLNRHFEARIATIAENEVLALVRDISDRKRSELQLLRLQDELRTRFDDLRRERDFVRAVIQAAPSYLCLVDDRGLIVRYNQALADASGRPDDDEVRGRPFWDVFVAPDEADEVSEAIDRASHAVQDVPERENTWVTASGERLAVAWSMTPLVEERGEARSLVTGMDITERKRQEEEVRSSRARIVEVASAERRRLERNLHDGAQQRLVSLSLFLRLAQGKVAEDPEAAQTLLDQGSDELSRALEELRELARGIHPAILTDRGLEPAIQALVTRSPVPVTLAEAPEERLPEPVEAAAYYVVAEALTNVAKYAQASAATVRVSQDNGYAIVEVADDGVGGANPAGGSGLRGLADRVAALDGRLEVESRPGRGTTIRAAIPV